MSNLSFDFGETRIEISGSVILLVAGPGISLYWLRDGRITETRNQADLFALFRQLGTMEKKQHVKA